MKRIGLFIVLFIGFSAINGYGRPQPDTTPPNQNQIPSPVQGGLDELTKNVDDLTKNVGELTKNVGDLTKRVDDLENPSEPEPTPPGPSQNQVPPADGPQFIPINWTIISEQKDSLGDLNYYVSKDISVTIPGSVKTGTRIRDGILEEVPDERPAEKLEISKDDSGKMIKFSAEPAGRESLEIFFSDKSAILTFTRNKTKNFFELTLVRKDGREIAVKDETIQLCIKYKGSHLVRTTGETESGGQHREPAQTARRGGPPKIPEKILLESGKGYLKREVVVDYMKNHNRSSWFNRRYDDISALVNAYFDIAKDEQVNPEIAIAQMWYATRALSRSDLLNNRNYAGLESVKGFNGRFLDSKIGVRAHIQHLKGYASKNRPKNIVDPRYEILAANGYLGRGTTLEKLSKWWSPNKDYEAEINGILRALYKYQYDSRR
jgi:hypothetical protein